jgi:hypothetical protein
MNLSGILLFLASFALPITVACQELAVDASGQIGTAILRPYYGNCYALTAFHVVANSASVTVVDVNKNVSIADVLKSYPQADIAILRLPTYSMCSTSMWPLNTQPTMNIVRNAAASGKLVRSLASGSMAQIPVTIVGISNGQFAVLPNQAIPIVSGWSGSGLYVSDVLVGILLSVNTSNNRGMVIPVDYVDRITSDFFTRGTKPDAFDLIVESQAFHDTIRTVLQSLTSNNLQSFNTDQHVAGASWPTDRFKASINLPGFNQPSYIEFHNAASYTKPVKLEKQPLRLDFLQIFPDNYDRQLLSARFDAIAGSIETVLPPGWAKSYYTQGINPLHNKRNEYRKGASLIAINLYASELLVEFSRQ